MADYTVRVVGENSGGSNSIPPSGSSPTPQPSATQGTQPQARDYMPDSNRLTEEYRKLIQQQGGVVIPGSANSRQIWSQVESSARQEVSESVRDKYAQRRLDVAQQRRQREAELDERNEQRHLDLDAWRDNERDKLLDKWRKARKNPDDPSNPITKSAEWRSIDKEYNETLKVLDAQSKKEFRQFELESKAEDKQVDKEEKDELAAALKELTSVLKDSKEAAERDDERGDTNSYIGRLRADRQRILQERDNAPTREEALAANKRLAEKDEEIRKATSTEQGKPVFDRFMMGMGGLQNAFSSLQNEDLGGAIQGAGSAVAGFSGMGLKAALRMNAITFAIGSAIRLAQQSNERYNTMADLAAYRSTTGGLQGKQSLMTAMTMMRDEGLGKSHLTYADLGLDFKEFAQRATSTVRQRGTGQDWYSETLRQIGLERQFALSSGALEQGSQFDRYGQTVTNAITTLVSTLNQYGIEGARGRDFSRVQEKYDFQQNLMQGYMARTDKPSYDYANQAVLAMNLVQGITHDKRDVTDYAQLQEVVTAPKNDRMRAMLFSTVSEMMSEMKDSHGNYYSATDAGRMDLIDRAIRNPENEGKIMQAMIQKISEMYGGIDTQMGYFAFKSIFPQISPDRLDEYVKQFSSPYSDAGYELRRRPDESMVGVEKGGAASTSEALVLQSKEYMHGMTAALKDVKKSLNELVDIVSGNAYVTPVQVNLPSGQ